MFLSMPFAIVNVVFLVMKEARLTSTLVMGPSLGGHYHSHLRIFIKFEFAKTFLPIGNCYYAAESLALGVDINTDI